MGADLRALGCYPKAFIAQRSFTACWPRSCTGTARAERTAYPWSLREAQARTVSYNDDPPAVLAAWLLAFRRTGSARPRRCRQDTPTPAGAWQQFRLPLGSRCRCPRDRSSARQRIRHRHSLRRPHIGRERSRSGRDLERRADSSTHDDIRSRCDMTTRVAARRSRCTLG
jgi:hypothetical protein